MEKVHLILLSGMGNQQLSLVNDDAWNWVNSDDRGREGADPDAFSWIDSIVPESVMKGRRLEAASYDDPNEPVRITMGSWQNDRAMACPANMFPDITVDVFDINLGAVFTAIVDAGYTVGETFLGALY